MKRSHPPFVVLPHAQSLAFCPLAGKRRRRYELPPLVDAHSYPALARALSECGKWARVSGPLQGVPNPGRRSSVHGLALRRTQSAAGRFGQAGGTVALEQPGSSPRRCGGSHWQFAPRVAGADACGLGGACQSCGNGGGTPSRAAFSDVRPALWIRVVAEADGAAPQLGEHLPQPGPTQEKASHGHVKNGPRPSASPFDPFEPLNVSSFRSTVSFRLNRRKSLFYSFFQWKASAGRRWFDGATVSHSVGGIGPRRPSSSSCAVRGGRAAGVVLAAVCRGLAVAGVMHQHTPLRSGFAIGPSGQGRRIDCLFAQSRATRVAEVHRPSGVGPPTADRGIGATDWCRVGRARWGKKQTPALTVPQVQAMIARLLDGLVKRNCPSRIRRTMARRLKRNEEARLYHWHRRKRLPPRRFNSRA